MSEKKDAVSKALADSTEAQKKIAELTKENKKLKERMLRTAGDFENYRKSVELGLVKVPMGCRARYEFIDQMVEELAESWVNGNKRVVWERVEEMPKSVAIALSSRLSRTAIGFAEYAMERA